MPAIGSDAVRRQWARQMVAEYRSSALAQELTLWLTRLGASPDLISSGLRIAAHEVDHARLSHEIYLAAGGQTPAALDRNNMAIMTRPDDLLEERVLDAAVTVFCLGETVAVPLFRHPRAGCDVGVSRCALDRIVRDEARHSSFGWDLHDWLLDGPCEGFERRVELVLPSGFRSLEMAYGNHGRALETAMPDVDRAWGLAPRAEYASILQETFERIWKLRFASFGVDAGVPWQARHDAPG